MRFFFIAISGKIFSGAPFTSFLELQIASIKKKKGKREFKAFFGPGLVIYLVYLLSTEQPKITAAPMKGSTSDLQWPTFGNECL